MLWRNSRRSDNVEDERGAGGGGFGGGGFGGGGFGGGGIKIGGLGLVAIVVICLLFGIDPSTLLQSLDSGGSYQQPYQPAQDQQQAQLGDSQSGDNAGTDEMKDFVRAVLGSTEDAWGEIFREKGRQYQAPKLVLFSNVIRSGCGVAQSATGPFYCPTDSRVYIDLSFYDELRRRFHAPGEFAEAYVIAHEVGHHVQNLLGLMDGSVAQQGATGKSVRTELQADCFAGIWANRANRKQHIVEEGDIDEALTAAAAIGDDRLQQAQGEVVPDSFTHGTSKQRVHWFKTGYQRGDIKACDTSGELD